MDTREKELEMKYEHNVFPGGITGDGFAMAYEAGAELVNMELI